MQEQVLAMQTDCFSWQCTVLAQEGKELSTRSVKACARPGSLLLLQVLSQAGNSFLVLLLGLCRFASAILQLLLCLVQLMASLCQLLHK